MCLKSLSGHQACEESRCYFMSYKIPDNNTEIRYSETSWLTSSAQTNRCNNLKKVKDLFVESDVHISEIFGTPVVKNQTLPVFYCVYLWWTNELIDHWQSDLWLHLFYIRDSSCCGFISSVHPSSICWCLTKESQTLTHCISYYSQQGSQSSSPTAGCLYRDLETSLSILLASKPIFKKVIKGQLFKRNPGDISTHFSGVKTGCFFRDICRHFYLFLCLFFYGDLDTFFIHFCDVKNIPDQFVALKIGII